MSLTGTDRGVGSRNTAAESTYAVAPTSNCTAGARLILFMAYDNSGASGADPWASGPTDTKSNTWTQIPSGSALNDPGAASAGTAMRAWTTAQNGGALTTGDTITIDFGGITTVARAFVLHEITATSGASVIEGGAAAAVSNATGTSTTPTVTSNTVQVGQMVIGAMGSEGNSAITADSDVTNGSWSTQQTSGIGSTTSGMQIASQRKVQTTTASTQTYNLTYTSEDWCIFSVIVTESVAKSDTETGAGVDAGESVAVAVADTETGSGADAGESVAAAASDTETVAAADAGESLAVAVADTETAVGVDAGENIDVVSGDVAISDTDTASGDDAGESIAASSTDTETGAGVDAGESVAVAVADTDGGVGVDSESLGVTLTDADIAAFLETEALAAALADTDIAVGVDDGAIVAQGPDLFPLTLTIHDYGHTGAIRDDGHTVSVLDTGHTLTVHDRGHTATMREQH